MGYAFAAHEVASIDQCFRAEGFVVVRGLWDVDQLAAMEAACADAQARLVRGELEQRHGSTALGEDDPSTSDRFANFVVRLTEIAPAVQEATHDPTLNSLARRWLGPDAWLEESTRFGVVYQDARPSHDSAYTRIGWHTDWQSGPQLHVWPSVAFTIHIDGTSPANGFLRVVPGSHLWATPAPYRNANNVRVPDGSARAAGHGDRPPPFEMPVMFDKVQGEIGVYCERGDLLLHDGYLWHSAARATDDDAIRRHIRGSWYSGPPLDPERAWDDEFVKNAAR
jgi:ectoine hydroxylase-related dioxygenase (phytanoyl-CoA dioxygenase family)